MKVLYQRNKFLTSSLEKQVFRKFEPFINQMSKSAADTER